MRAAVISIVLTIHVVASAMEEKPKPLPAPPAPAADKSDRWEPSAEWLAAIERLRIFPRPGEIVNGGVTAGVADVYEVSAAESEKIDKLVGEYDAALLKKAAQWEDEMKALRADCESKVIAALPDAKRDSAKKFLDFSHAKWNTPTEHEAKFKKEFAERAKAIRESSKNQNAEEVNDANEGLRAWVKEQRAKINKEDEDVVAGLKALLTEDEAQRLEKLNRHRVVTPPPVAPPEVPKPAIKKKRENAQP